MQDRGLRCTVVLAERGYKGWWSMIVHICAKSKPATATEERDGIRAGHGRKRDYLCWIKETSRVVNQCCCKCSNVLVYSAVQ